MQERAREWIGGLDLVSREEFEAVKAMAVAAREENEALRGADRRARRPQAGASRGARSRGRGRRAAAA